jgi:hypothetical protein
MNQLEQINTLSKPLYVTCPSCVVVMRSGFREVSRWFHLNHLQVQMTLVVNVLV